MLDRVLQHPDRSKLTRRQIAEIIPMKEAVRLARLKLNLMARSEVIFEGVRILFYPHPDKRETGALMVYDKRDEELFIDTPFSGQPSEAEVIAWVEAAQAE